MLPLALLDSVPLAAAVFLAGAVFGLQRSLLTTATPLGAAIGAISLEALSPAAVLALSASGCVLAGLAALASRDLRSAR